MDSSDAFASELLGKTEGQWLVMQIIYTKQRIQILNYAWRM